MYLMTRVCTPVMDFVTRQKCYYYNPEQARRPRGVRIVKTPLSKKKRNERRSYLKRQYQIFNNFGAGDWWITLTYSRDKRPADAAEGMRLLSRKLSVIQKRLKRKGIPFVYFASTEEGERGAVHHHVIIKNNFDVISQLYDVWEEYGSVKDFKKIYSMNKKLTAYFLRPENGHEIYGIDEAEDKGKLHRIVSKKFTHSRNLKEPKIEKRIYPAKSFRENPKAPAGYEIRNLKNFFPDIDGYTYQEYELVKIKQNEPDRKKAGKIKNRNRRC